MNPEHENLLSEDSDWLAKAFSNVSQYDTIQRPAYEYSDAEDLALDSDDNHVIISTPKNPPGVHVEDVSARLGKSRADLDNDIINLLPQATLETKRSILHLIRLDVTTSQLSSYTLNAQEHKALPHNHPPAPTSTSMLAESSNSRIQNLQEEDLVMQSPPGDGLEYPRAFYENADGSMMESIPDQSTNRPHSTPGNAPSTSFHSAPFFSGKTLRTNADSTDQRCRPTTSTMRRLQQDLCG
ncbi:hypothetical protein EJ04DRAFT_521142 [Polyplosphaeria fusca]|uniref:Uncharacterized protein n=1 Tax=Polyplosphaeria fusca TaxID=682080 RepID=A0A9P4R610_9PLEO|nr:hypothetical protein EJ04DRAFT_521142 [Polyplosphaeria fusca]